MNTLCLKVLKDNRQKSSFSLGLLGLEKLDTSTTSPEYSMNPTSGLIPEITGLMDITDNGWPCLMISEGISPTTSFSSAWIGTRSGFQSKEDSGTGDHCTSSSLLTAAGMNGTPTWWDDIVMHYEDGSFGFIR